MGILCKPRVLVAALLILLVTDRVLCQELAGSAASLQTIEVLLNQGDSQQALRLLQGLPEENLHFDQKLWRMARLQYEMGRIAASAQDAMMFYQRAEKFARSAIANNPDSGEGYKWLAIALGAQTKESDTQTQKRLSREVKENIEKAIALAPEDDIAYLVLSRWHYKVSALGFMSRAISSIVYGGLPEGTFLRGLLNRMFLR